MCWISTLTVHLAITWWPKLVRAVARAQLATSFPCTVPMASPWTFPQSMSGTGLSHACLYSFLDSCRYTGLVIRYFGGKWGDYWFETGAGWGSAMGMENSVLVVLCQLQDGWEHCNMVMGKRHLLPFPSFSHPDLQPGSCLFLPLRQTEAATW